MPIPSHPIRRPAMRAGLIALAALGCVQAVQAQTARDDDQASGGAAATLPAVTVRENAALRPMDLPPAHAGRQVASGTRLGLLGSREVMETPFSTISYTSEHVQNTQAHGLADVVSRTDPAVFNNGATGMLLESMSIRGFNVAHRDMALGGLYGLTPFYRVTPEMFERVEVHKGPSALLGGMPPGGSVGGAVNLVPKRAGSKPLTQLTGTFMNEGQWGLHADVGRRFGPQQEWGVRFNAVWRDGKGPVKPQKLGARLAALGLDWRGARARFSADLFESRDSLDGVNRGISLAPGVPLPRAPNPRTLLAPDWTFGKSKDRAVILRGEWDVTPNVTLWANAGQGKFDFDSIASSVYRVADTQGTFINDFAHQRDQRDRRAASAGLHARFATGSVAHQLAASFDWQHEQREFGFLLRMLSAPWVTNLYRPAWGPAVSRAFSNAALPPSGNSRLSGLAVADTLSFADGRVQLTVGVRRQKVSSASSSWFNPAAPWTFYKSSATSPAVAVLLKASEQVSVYANYIEGLSEGQSAPLGTANAGQLFAPYKTRQHEIGVKLAQGDLTHTVALFQIKQPSAWTDPVTNRFTADGRQRNRGLEWSVTGQLRAGLRVLGGASWTQATLTRTAGGVNQGKQAVATPRRQAKLGLEWDALPGLTLAGNLRSASRQYIDAANTLHTPGRTVFDVGARYVLPTAGRRITLRASVQNLTNKAYWAGQLYSGLGAPRTVLLSATVDF